MGNSHTNPSVLTARLARTGPHPSGPPVLSRADELRAAFGRQDHTPGRCVRTGATFSVPGMYVRQVRKTTGLIGAGRVLPVLLSISAIYALLVALLSGEPLHRLWGAWACAGYAAAALIAALWKAGRGPAAAAAVSLAGALAGPLVQLAAQGRNMPEVSVIEHAAALLLHQGSPYALTAQQALPGFLRYNPYLPVMTIFGLPHALAGPGVLTDPRLWAGAVFAGLVALALRVQLARPAGRTGVLLLASPFFAFPIAVSGNDLPVIGLLCLGLAFAAAPRRDPAQPAVAGGPAGAGRRSSRARYQARYRASYRASPVLAGLAIGLAAAMKATAWPAIAVVAALLWARSGPAGRRPARNFLLAAVAVVMAAVGPWAIADPGALAQNTILFPLGLTRIKTPATSPLPGHLLAGTGHAGYLIAVAALGLAAAVLVASLVLRPPATSTAAAIRLALGLALMFAFAPATRWGYFVYPAGLCAWAWLARRPGPAPGSRDRQPVAAKSVAAEPVAALGSAHD